MWGFEMLIGSPNLAGVMWMLIQHQAELGPKKVVRLRMWRDARGTYAPHMAMEIADANTNGVAEVVGAVGAALGWVA
jgi:hypothetical protein